MSQLFGRSAVVEVGVPGTVGKSITDLRIAFRFTFDRKGEPNKGTVRIYNPFVGILKDFLFAPSAVVRVLAGYEIPLQIFEGNPVKDGIHVEMEGPDRIVKVDLADGGNLYKRRHVTINMASQSTLSQVVASAIAQSGLPTGTVQITNDVVFSQGFVYEGPLSDLLDDLALTAGGDWFVRDGVISFIPEGGSTGETAVVFSSAAGNLIGAPSVTKEGLEWTALLSPSMRPGKVAQVETRDPFGLYVAETVEFVGDTEGQDWYTKILGRPYVG